LSAVFSPCGIYRLELRREVDPLLAGLTAALCGVNPSTAGAEDNDATIRKDMGFARVLGWSHIIKINKFARMMLGTMGRIHTSDCSTHNEPASPNEACDCGAEIAA
jgi:hypothetical protein